MISCKYALFITFSLIASCYSQTAAPLVCGSHVCPLGNDCCADVTLGPTCYDPTSYTCTTGSRGPVLCGNQEHGPDYACGVVCYDPTEYQCCANELYGVNDPLAPLHCTAPTCASLACGAGLSCCPDITLGPVCYNPATYTCPTGNLGPVLCGNQEHGPDAACGTICYDPTEYVCCGDQIYGISDPNIPCSATCSHLACGAGLSCCDDVTLGPVCYDPATYTCPNGSRGPVLCGNQAHGPDFACGTICYDRTEYVCCGDEIYGIAEQGIPCLPTQAPTKAPTKPPGAPSNPNNPNGADGADNSTGPDNSDGPDGPDGADNPDGPDNSDGPDN